MVIKRACSYERSISFNSHHSYTYNKYNVISLYCRVEKRAERRLKI
ncbi:MAG: hypothetical protein AABW50_00045 [Nanoarchaeota archaeon]